MIKRSDNAFTLIELLAVIAIVGILAAIIVPVVGKVKDSAKDAGCRNNLRQLHAAFAGYIADTGKMPYRYNITYEKSGNENIPAGSDASKTDPVNSDLDAKTGSYYWYRNLYGYLSLTRGQTGTTDWYSADTWYGNPKAWGPYACPADSRYFIIKMTQSELLAKFGASSINQTSYIYNNRLLTPPRDSTGTLRASAVTKNPIVLLDGYTAHLNPNQTNIRTYVRWRHGTSDEYDYDADKDGTLVKGGHCNVLFFDGMVRSFRQGKLPAMGESGPQFDNLKGDDLWLPY